MVMLVAALPNYPYLLILLTTVCNAVIFEELIL